MHVPTEALPCNRRPPALALARASLEELAAERGRARRQIIIDLEEASARRHQDCELTMFMARDALAHLHGLNVWAGRLWTLRLECWVIDRKSTLHVQGTTGFQAASVSLRFGPPGNSDLVRAEIDWPSPAVIRLAPRCSMAPSAETTGPVSLGELIATAERRVAEIVSD